MKSLIREPLLHFLLLGAAIFAAYSLVSRGSSGEGGKIVVTQGQLASIWEGFTRTRQREPTTEEWVGAIRDRVREEVYYREALALGLDKDDTVIRRRLQQKLEFVSDDVAVQAEPTDAELTAYLREHSDKFRMEPRVTFRQLYLDPQKHGRSLADDAARLLAQVNQAGASGDTARLGDPLMLDREFHAIPPSDIARLFGAAFAKAVDGLSAGRWHGPVESSFGVHLVFVSERTPGRAAALADVHDVVRREWEDARRVEAKEKAYQQMLRRYTVTVEQPQPSPLTVASASVK